jgi:ankyrin repeat protein
MINHKLDFEDVAGVRWFLERGADVNAIHCLHHAICRGRGLTIITMLLDAGADVNRPWDGWDRGRRPLALAARCGHLAAYELLQSHGATAEFDPVDAAVLAVARGESVELPDAPPPALGIPSGTTTVGSSGSSRSSATPRSSERCSTPGCRWTRADGATSRRSTRPPCTAAWKR